MNTEYELLKGLRGILKRDASAFKKHLFDSVLKEKPFALVLYRLMSTYSWTRYLTAVLYFAYIYFRHESGIPKRSHFTMYVHANELKTLKLLFTRSQLKKIHFDKRSWKFIYKNLSSIPWQKVPSAFRAIGLLGPGRPLFVTLRAAEYLACYFSFYRRLRCSPVDSVLILTDNNPHGLALLHVSLRLNIQATFISHGEPQEPLHALRCRYAVLLGDFSLGRYLEAGSSFSHVLYLGYKDKFCPMKLPPKQPRTVGVFLSKLTDVKKLSALLGEVDAKFKPKEFLLRPHPGFPKSKLAELKNTSSATIRLTQNHAVEDDIQACDLIISGNSTVHLDALLNGRPSLYASELEEGFYDRYGYIAEGLIKDWRDDFLLDEFYGSDLLTERLSEHLAIDQSPNTTVTEVHEKLF